MVVGRADPADHVGFAPLGDPVEDVAVETALDEEQRRQEPAAGLAYRFDTDTTGVPAMAYRPDPDWWRESIARRAS